MPIQWHLSVQYQFSTVMNAIGYYQKANVWPSAFGVPRQFLCLLSNDGHDARNCVAINPSNAIGDANPIGSECPCGMRAKTHTCIDCDPMPDRLRLKILCDECRNNFGKVLGAYSAHELHRQWDIRVRLALTPNGINDSLGVGLTLSIDRPASNILSGKNLTHLESKQLSAFSYEEIGVFAVGADAPRFT
jgi:hypothetical protein